MTRVERHNVGGRAINYQVFGGQKSSMGVAGVGTEKGRRTGEAGKGTLGALLGIGSPVTDVLTGD